MELHPREDISPESFNRGEPSPNEIPPDQGRRADEAGRPRADTLQLFDREGIPENTQALKTFCPRVRHVETGIFPGAITTVRSPADVVQLTAPVRRESRQDTYSGTGGPAKQIRRVSRHFECPPGVIYRLRRSSSGNTRRGRACYKSAKGSATTPPPSGSVTSPVCTTNPSARAFRTDSRNRKIPRAMAGDGVAVAFTSKGSKPAGVSMTRSTSSPVEVRQKYRRGSAPRCRNDFNTSITTAVSAMAPAIGPAAACT